MNQFDETYSINNKIFDILLLLTNIITNLLL
jgi:hypothetical protein